MYSFVQKLKQLPVKAFSGLFRLWQISFSVLLPPSCRFTPSCSHYGIEALKQHGLFAGLWLTTWRILRCNPWGGCGHDPVPKRFRLFPKPFEVRDE